MAAIILTTSEKAAIDGVDSQLDSAFLDGVNNPDTSQNVPPLQGYSQAGNIVGVNYKPNVRNPFRGILASLFKVLSVLPETFTSASFQNSWTDFGAPWASAAFYKDPFNRVHLKGLIKSGTIGGAAFTLPVGHRPTESLIFSSVSNSALGRVNVLLSGEVVPASPSSNVWVSLDGISFKV